MPHIPPRHSTSSALKHAAARRALPTCPPAAWLLLGRAPSAPSAAPAAARSAAQSAMAKPWFMGFCRVGKGGLGMVGRGTNVHGVLVGARRCEACEPGEGVRRVCVCVCAREVLRRQQQASKQASKQASSFREAAGPKQPGRSWEAGGRGSTSLREGPPPQHLPSALRRRTCRPLPRGRSLLRSSMRQTYLRRGCWIAQAGGWLAGARRKTRPVIGCSQRTGPKCEGQFATTRLRCSTASPGAAGKTGRQAAPCTQQNPAAHFLARRTAVGTSAPLASSAAMAAARLQPVP